MASASPRDLAPPSIDASPTQSRPFIKPLTSLRFFAALMVVAHHYFDFRLGYSGVTFFYVLSGFVLTVNNRQLTTVAARKAFWWKRFARIYPNHLLTLLICVPVVAGSPGAFLVSALVVQSWVPIWSYYFAFNAPAWSISNEAFFYAIFPWLLGWLRTSPNFRIFILGVLGVFVATAWTILFPSQTMNSSATHFLFYISPPMRVIEFATGIALGRATIERRFGLFHELGALALLISSFVLPAPPAFKAALFFLPSAAALIFVYSRSDGPLSKLLSKRALVLLGDASFSLYMIHYPLARYLGTGVIQLLAAIALSVVMLIWFERPVQAWLLNRPLKSQRPLPMA